MEVKDMKTERIQEILDGLRAENAALAADIVRKDDLIGQLNQALNECIGRVERLERRQAGLVVAFCGECGTRHQSGQCTVSSRGY
jgi:hypothetical protein